MEEFKVCTECFRPEVCTSNCECSIVKHSLEQVAQICEEEMFMEWINEHATNRDRGEV